MPQMRTSSKLAQLAEDQWGLLTRRQAEATGISPATFQRLSGPDGPLERMTHGVYHLAGAPLPDHAPLRAAWLALAPATLAWERRPEEGVVSHRSAAAVHRLGELPADRHDFIVAGRKQTRRPDVRIHRAVLRQDEWQLLRGLPVTTPARTAADLLADREDPGAVARVVADSLERKNEWAGNFPAELEGRSASLGLAQGDGLAALAFLLHLAEAPQADRWLSEAQTKSVELPAP
jgi:predicted transcriptional regulator of viral defense system